MHVVGMLSRHSSAPRSHHWEAAKHVLRYLKATRDMELCYDGTDVSMDRFASSSFTTTDTARITYKIDEKPESSHITRYLADQQLAAGLVIVIHDHLLSLSEEVDVFWKSPRSLSRSLFLVNRYLIPAVLITAAYNMCGFTSSLTHTMPAVNIYPCYIGYTPHRHGLFVDVHVGSSNMGELQSVAIDEMWLSKSLIGVWVAPMVFDLMALVCIVMNTLSRPRRADLLLYKALRSDGIIFFAPNYIFMTVFMLKDNPSVIHSEEKSSCFKHVKAMVTLSIRLYELGL
ncbi:hypothetical protein SERLA73DRAFT_156380 [Serpula lacrymans var. lacrymans S7.3]|uniref:DUF6533 domain-containing protein n=1 Tax=Serpula lacrymans var. lacrymans (strain S7.3) TaxID=936435 RepID=F8QE81_SERL3|nr:hypothetical protein SERLA73DRAFT_156380 [Serpula lacrymans var. lacrymans S7.3]